MPKISGGYFIKARQIKNSFIAHASPCVREIWDYLLREANHSDEKHNGFVIKRGQLFRNYKEIRDDLSWFVGYRKEMYNESQTKHAMNILKKELMITTTKKPRGVLITICNYDFYQNPKNYERTNERTTNEPSTNQQPPSINKNEKNLRNKEEINTPLTPHGGNDVELKDFLLKNIPDDLRCIENKFVEYFEYRQQKPKAKRYKSPKGISGLFRDIGNCVANGYDPATCLDIAMERDWQTTDPTYFKPEMFKSAKIIKKEFWEMSPEERQADNEAQLARIT